MGRELRMVPADWEHPRKTDNNYQPAHAKEYEIASAEWRTEFAKWDREEKEMDYWEYDPPPDRDHYVDYAGKPCTWFQVYETVSEGTPVTPPFETKEELIEYLVAHGDFWDQKRRQEGCTFMECGPWSRAAAESFVRDTGWAPSFVFTAGKGIESGHEAFASQEPK